MIWSRAGVSITSCPVSYVTPFSLALLEQYAGWRMEGHRELMNQPARRADAFAVLEEETRKVEENNGGR